MEYKAYIFTMNFSILFFFVEFEALLIGLVLILFILLKYNTITNYVLILYEMSNLCL